MTEQEKQEIVAAVLQALATNSKTIEQLTAVAQMSDSDYLELDGGRKVSYATLLYGYLKTATFNNAMTNIINLMASLKGNAANLPGTELDKLYWRQSPIVLLSSMGEYYDGDNSYTPQIGDVFYSGSLATDSYQLWEKTQGGSTGRTGYAASAGVLYVNKRTGKMYEWTGSQTAWRLIVNPGGGGGGSIVKDVKYENGYLVFTFDTEQGDEVVSVPVNFDASNYVPITRTVNGKALSQNITLSQSDINGLVAALAAKVSGIKVNNGETQTPTNGVVNLEIQGGSSVDVVDNLNSTDGTKALSAKQGKVLDDKIAGKQNTLTFDNTPTQNSNNVVKSGGIYTALQTLLSNITVGQNGNWYVGETDTGVKAQGPKGNSVVDGDTFEIVNNLIDGGEGDALSAEMGKQLNQTKASIDDASSEVDLDITDEDGNVLVRFANGHVQTALFNSATAFNNYYTKAQVDAAIAAGAAPAKLKVLVIGNSFSCDSFSYLPFILKENYGIDIELWVMYYGGAYTAQIASNYSSLSCIRYSIDTSQPSYAWSAQNGVTPHAAVTAQTWDLIVLQQGSAKSYDLTNYTASVKSLIQSIQDDCDYQVKLGWNINHIGTTHFTAQDKSNWQNVLNCCKIQPAAVVFPYGTAVFNAMDVFSSKGTYGYMTYDEAGHLQEGLPCYLAAIANIQALFDEYYPTLHLSVIGDAFTPDSTKRMGGEQAHGTLLTMTADERLICQTAAVVANRDKFNVNPVQ